MNCDRRLVVFRGLVALLFLGLTTAPSSASILPLTLANDGSDVITPATTPQFSIWFHPPNNPLVSTVSGWIGLTVTELYKADADPFAESGSFASSYSTTFDNEPDDPADALLEYDSGSKFTSSNLFALLKDGKQDEPDPVVYIFNISSWDRTSDLSFEGFWPGNGAISHLSIYGAGGGTTGGNPPGVPEPLSVLVWMALCVSFGFSAKRIR